jgi:NTE family protein
MSAEQSAAATGEPVRAGICLSGGGFRAALYGLGVLRYLAEAEFLPSVVTLCGVSGGSIAATAAAAGWLRSEGPPKDRAAFDAAVFDRFLSTIDAHDIRDRTLARWAAQRWKPWGKDRGDVLGEVLTELLFPELRRLSDLPVEPQLVITTTELGAGRAFRFSRDFMGGWDAGYAAPVPGPPVGRAVAASAAVPMIFPPLRLKTKGQGFKPQVSKRLVLVDGGVYDNGLEWIQGWGTALRPLQAVEANFTIAINASGPLGTRRHLWGALAWNRSRSVQYAQTQATRVRWLVEQFTSGRRLGMYLGITGDPRTSKLPSGHAVPPHLHAGALPTSLVSVLADVRTDLNRFGSTEAQLLAYHGYWSAHARTAALHPSLAVAGKPSWDEYADLGEKEAAQLAKYLSRPWRRFGVASKLR